MKPYVKGTAWLVVVWALLPGAVNSASPKPEPEPIQERVALSHPREINLERLIETSVTSSAGEDLGKLTDIVVDLRSGEVVFAIVQHGGFLGIGGRLVPVPWHLVTLMAGNELVAAIDAQTIKSAPTTDKTYTKLANPGFIVAVRDFYSHGAMGGAEAP